ncbi:MAG TPA: hypothetical protein VMM18_05130 [Gemmatimonadaceae bacterium]|nr:hypothetical protein [Gemmatimonadaceae bacterium]
MKRSRSCIAASIGVFVVAGACFNPGADIATGEMILGLTDAVEDLRMETSILQDQIDSLSVEITRQDSLIRRLADHTGLYMPPR